MSQRADWTVVVLLVIALAILEWWERLWGSQADEYSALSHEEQPEFNV